MSYLVSILRYALTIGILFGFPALALWGLRTGGRRRLGLATLAAFAVVTLYALMTASARFGNALASSDGYARTATTAFFMFSLTLGLPHVTTTLAVLVFARDKLPFWTVYAATVSAAAFGWIGGILGAFALLL